MENACVKEFLQADVIDGEESAGGGPATAGGAFVDIVVAADGESADAVGGNGARRTHDQSGSESDCEPRRVHAMPTSLPPAIYTNRHCPYELVPIRRGALPRTIRGLPRVSNTGDLGPKPCA